MTRRDYNFQPGALLHEAIIGAFRANGTNFDAWCRENGVLPTSGRQATFGQSRGENGRRVLAAMIAAAGEDFVRHIYEKRLLDHAAEVQRARVPVKPAVTDWRGLPPPKPPKGD